MKLNGNRLNRQGNRKNRIRGIKIFKNIKLQAPNFNKIPNFNIDKVVKNPKTVMPDLIPAEDGIFDRHPEAVEFTGFRLSPE